MTDLKERRQRAIAELIRGHALSSQEELADRLGSLGFAVTQATISRDLEQIGAVKVRREGQLSYALPEGMSVAPPRLAAMVQYQTPYSFMLPGGVDERTLPFRRLTVTRPARW